MSTVSVSQTRIRFDLLLHLMKILWEKLIDSENLSKWQSKLYNAVVCWMKEHIKQFKMSRFRARRQNNGYFQVPSDDSGFSDAQFDIPPPKIPWKAITLAAFLFVVGSILLLAGSLIVTGHIDTKYSDRLWPMIVLGGIMFLPGIYHIRIAYYAYKEYPGYSFSDIPEFE